MREIIYKNRGELVWKQHWFSIFSENPMSLKHFSYRHFCQEYTKSQILTLTAINEDFFDFRFHYSVEVLLNGNAQTFHVVLNEVNVVESFFDPKVDVGVFGNNHLSALWRLVECKCQNNEAPVESIIGTFSNQTFRSQSEQTGEDRAIIKVNGDGNIAGLLKIAPTIAQLSSEGVPEWGIEPLNLPITYGRYKRSTLPKSRGTAKVENFEEADLCLSLF